MSNTYYKSALQCAGLVHTHMDWTSPTKKNNNDKIGHLAFSDNKSRTSVSWSISTKSMLNDYTFLIWNCNLVQYFWFAVRNFLMICGITLPLNGREITLGISESYIEN